MPGIEDLPFTWRPSVCSGSGVACSPHGVCVAPWILPAPRGMISQHGRAPMARYNPLQLEGIAKYNYY